MFSRAFILALLCLGLGLPAFAVTGSGDSATGPLETVAPAFSGLTMTPPQAAAGTVVTLQFSGSEALEDDAVVTVNGNPAVRTAKAAYSYEYTVLGTDPFGLVDVEISGVDLVGNPGTLSAPGALEIVPLAPSVPLRAWPVALALLAVGVLLLAACRKASALLVLALMAAPVAMAAVPAVSNVAFVQQSTVTGTEVVISYDLVAPNGPCAVTVFLSKNGGGDGFSFPVTSVTGAVSGVTTGTGKQIVWNIATDYPNENIPNARLRVTANDGITQYTLTYTAGAGGTISGITPQTVNSGGNGTAVTAVANSGFAFSSWSDGVLTAARTDTNVLANVAVTANFVALTTYYKDADSDTFGQCGDFVLALAPSGQYTATICGDCNDFNLAINPAATEICGNAVDENCNGSLCFTLNYTAGTGGTISGTASQTVSSGGSGAAVTAVANSGFAFVKWSDNSTANPRTDTNVLANVSVSASFTVAVEMISVAGGSFSMGRTAAGDDATYGGSDELPVHTVTLSAYKIGKYEVTNQQYCNALNYAIAPARNYLRTSANGVWSGTGDIYAGGNLQKILGFTNANCNIQFSAGLFSPKTRVGLPGSTNYSTGTHPVQTVTWFGAVSFANWLSEMEGQTAVYDASTAGWPANLANNGYHLPTEAQWERAAAWDGTKHWMYSFTADTLTGNSRANYSSNDPLGLTTDPPTSPAGWFDGVNVSPNGTVSTTNSVSPVGAYDMSGNVWEWCHDWYLNTYYTTSPGTDPPGAASGSYRVFRGGGWEGNPGYCRSAQRVYNAPDNAVYYIGFRLAR